MAETSMEEMKGKKEAPAAWLRVVKHRARDKKKTRNKLLENDTTSTSTVAHEVCEREIQTSQEYTQLQ